MTYDRKERQKIYVDEIAAIGGISSTSLLDAIHQIYREKFLPPGPWQVERLDGSQYKTQDADISRILHAVGVSLDATKVLNSGNPAKISRFLEQIDLKPGETIFHVGAGLGYFSAIMSQLVGPAGQVIAAEIEPDFAAQARRNLANFPNVAVIGDALALDLPPVDAIFASAGMATIPPSWVTRLRVGGRMLLPLTGAHNSGFVFLFQKIADELPFRARVCSFLAFYPCRGSRDEAGMQAIDAALAHPIIGSGESMVLRFDAHPRETRCWLHRDDFCIGQSDATD